MIDASAQFISVALSRGANGDWLRPAAVLAVVLAGAAMAWLDPLIAQLVPPAKAAALAAMRDGSVILLLQAAALATAWTGVVVLLKPMLLLALLVLIERALLRDPAHGKRLLAWSIRALYLVAAYAVGLLLSRLHPDLPGPLISLSAPGVGGLLETAIASLAFVLLMLATDFFRYWVHRAFHRYAFLWRFHSVHHSPRDLDILHNFVHPVEAVAAFALIGVPVSMLLETGGDHFALLAAFFLVQSDLAHSRAELHFGRFGRFVVDNRYHFIHHSREPGDFDVNFAALFPVWDRMFGTCRPPADDSLRSTGLEDRLPPRRLGHYLLARLPAAE